MSVATDVPPPRAAGDRRASPGPRITPKQQIGLYSPDDWEEFILEWARGLGQGYHQVKRVGGPNDHGADVAGLVTPAGFEGPWDCFQCKHYGRALRPTDIWPELKKVMLATIDGFYTWPREYDFLAPLGSGGSLEILFSSPGRLRAAFLEQLESGKQLVSDIPEPRRVKLFEFASSVDYSAINSVQIEVVLDVHKRTEFYYSRFSQPLPGRPDLDDPPESLAKAESTYIAKLLDVYREKSSPDGTLEELTTPELHGDHFLRQRTAFYSAEALRVFSRDNVPEGEFESLKQGVFDTVIEVHDREHPCGLDRLSEVLTSSLTTSTPGNILYPRTEPLDKRGICHQLANEDRLTWVRGDSSAGS